MIKKIDWYVVTELVKPFLLVVLGVVVVIISMSLGDDIDKIIKNGIPYQVILKNILARIPDYIIQALPIGYLSATMLTTSRLSRDHETTALKASGIKSKRIMFPIILVSLLVSLSSYFINEKIVPVTNQYSQKAMDDFEKAKNQGLVNNNIYFRGPDNNFFHVVKTDRDKKTMESITVASVDINKDRTIILAKMGSWNGKLWDLRDGVVQYYPKNSEFVEKEERFNQKTIDAKVDINEIILEQKNPSELSAKKLKELIESKKTAGFQATELETQYYIHYARPCATFFSATIASPLGFMFSRASNYIGYALSIILIFIYYIAEALGKVLGLNGILPPFYAAWASNIVFAFNGLILLWLVDRK
ncbi:MAG: LptF/LptG family permease [Candidatus Sericytochromatia bacterium]